MELPAVKFSELTEDSQSKTLLVQFQLLGGFLGLCV